MHKLHWPSVKVLCIGHYGVIGKAKGCDTLDLLANTLPNSPIGQTKITMWVSSKCGTILLHKILTFASVHIISHNKWD